MSLIGVHPGPDKTYSKYSSHRRNNSGELDVFDATKYFSGANDDHNNNPGDHHHKNISGHEKTIHFRKPTRMSLDLPITKNNPILNDSPHYQNNRKAAHTKDNKKHKVQPSSPGARLASFLNSLLNQTSLKKKKKSNKDDENKNPNGRRKRRNSIGHFFISSSNSDVGVKINPHPGYPKSPAKSCKDFRNLSAKATIRNEIYGGKSKCTPNDGSLGFSSEEHRDFGKFDDDEGADSDSSSDLFDLPNHDLDFCSSDYDLPVYQTTRLDRIKIGN